MLRMKYPRTPHLPWSRPDESDVWMDQEFDPETYVVVTEKLDGENTSIYQDGTTHARSMDSKDHPSRHKLKALAASLARQFTNDEFVILGENVFAKHSIYYPNLWSHFLMFGVRHRDNMVSWETVEDIAKYLGVPTVPILWEGQWKDFSHDLVWPRESTFGPESEGYVVRNVEGFRVKDFRKNVAKFVRKNHIQTDQHWLKQRMVVNGLKNDT